MAQFHSHNLRVETLGSLVVYVGSDRQPSKEEWLTYLNLIDEQLTRHPLSSRVLIISGAAGPDAVQRRQAAAVVKGRVVRCAVVSDSFIARSVVTALSWFSIDIRAFSADRSQAAFQFLGLTCDEITWARRVIDGDFTGKRDAVA